MGNDIMTFLVWPTLFLLAFRGAWEIVKSESQRLRVNRGRRQSAALDSFLANHTEEEIALRRQRALKQKESRQEQERIFQQCMHNRNPGNRPPPRSK